MRTKRLLLGLLLPCACVCRPPEPQADPLDSAWADFGRSRTVAVQIERRLFEQAGNPHFLIRVRVTNLSDSVVGVDLRYGSRVFYPNQWGGLSQPERGIIDEEILEPLALTPALVGQLKADYQANSLVMIPVGGSAEYFRASNASSRRDIDGATAPYLFISIKGQLLVTDGVRAESLLPAADSLYLRTPASWEAVPAAARVVPDRGADPAR